MLIWLVIGTLNYRECPKLLGHWGYILMELSSTSLGTVQAIPICKVTSVDWWGRFEFLSWVPFLEMWCWAWVWEPQRRHERRSLACLCFHVLRKEEWIVQRGAEGRGRGSTQWCSRSKIQPALSASCIPDPWDALLPSSLHPFMLRLYQLAVVQSSDWGPCLGPELPSYYLLVCMYEEVSRLLCAIAPHLQNAPMIYSCLSMLLQAWNMVTL